MSKPRIAIIGLLAVLWSESCLANGLNYSVQNWQIEQGLPQSSVTEVIKSRAGYLWLGTFNGLARFDGVHFTVFDKTSEPELENPRVTSLFEDANACLWIGHEAGEVTRYQNGLFERVPVGIHPNMGSARSFCQDKTGQIWMLTIGGFLVRVSDGTCIPPPSGSSLEDSRNKIVQDLDGKLWIMRNGKVSLIDNGAPVPGLVLESPDAEVKAICAARDGGLWAFYDGIARRWARGRWTGEQRALPVPQVVVTTLAETSLGDVAVGTYGQGLFLLPAKGRPRQYSHLNGLTDDQVRSFAEDCEGNLWVGTGYGGLDAMHPSNLLEVRPPNNWEKRAVLATCAGRDGGLWIGTEGAGVYHYLNDNWEQFGTESGLSNLYVWSIVDGADGTLLVGTWGEGLWRRMGGKFKPVQGFARSIVTALFEDHRGTVWVGTSLGLAQICGTAVKWYNRAEDAPISNIRCIAEDSDGGIWCGLNVGGLALRTNGGWKVFRKEDGLTSDYVQCLRPEPGAILWVGTMGGGLCRYRAGRFAAVGPKQGLPNNVTCAIEDDGLGNYWISSLGGIFRVNKQELNLCAEGKASAIHATTYGKDEGLPSMECSGGFEPAAAKTPDGRIWFPTRKGLAGVLPRTNGFNGVAPPVVIEQVMVDGHVASPSVGQEPLIIQPGQGRLEFHYTGLSFAAPEKVLFKHRLEGLESEWGKAEPQRSADYSYLAPGHYLFRVMACNNDGVWNESGASLALVVLPHFWQTWWFATLACMAGAACVGWAVLFETRRQHRRKMQLMERQREVERERGRIANDIHDDVGASLTYISMLSEANGGEAKVSLENLGRIHRTARELTRSMDEIVWAVNPKHDTLESLAVYLSRFAHDFLSAANIRCRLDMPEQVEAGPLRTEVRHNLFLVFKETLHNIVGHASASEVRVSLALAEDNIVLTVADDGRGFDLNERPNGSPTKPDRVSQGDGLGNIRRRLADIHGECEIQTAMGKGTTLRITVPLQT
jgi:signal transduction histidine kinase/ligand-binding sensor domain-containing protein